MSGLDWTVLTLTLAYIVGYGVWKTRGIRNTEDYLMGKRQLPWWTIGLSVVATQASAITFLSTPGQAFEDGMRFVQFYMGLPIAMVILSVTILPIYYKLKVYTAYEYLEGRFDLRTRVFTAILFLIQRGMAAGIVIYAPAIILSTIMGWDLLVTIWIMGALVIIYTVSGGTDAVSQTQKQQMIIILAGMVVAGFVLVSLLPTGVSFGNAVDVAGRMGKLNVIDLEFDLSNKYNIWTGLLGGTFLMLSYFGTDQSQVQRYLSGRTLKESRLGLMFNAVFKVPMQFMVLFLGVLLFVFYQFHQPPVFFNKTATEQLRNSEYASAFEDLEKQHTQVFNDKKLALHDFIKQMESEDETAINQAEARVKTLSKEAAAIKANVIQLVNKVDRETEAKDSDYVFITFVLNYLPKGLVGLLLAVIFSAAMSTTASELNALATTTTIDLYKRNIRREEHDQHYLKIAKLFTVGWGIVALFFATIASHFDNLIEAVNIVGSLFYGAILGIFLVAFYFKKIGGKAVFFAAILAEILVITIFVLDKLDIVQIAYLWLNLIGCVLVVIFALALQNMDRKPVEA